MINFSFFQIKTKLETQDLIKYTSKLYIHSLGPDI